MNVDNVEVLEEGRDFDDRRVPLLIHHRCFRERCFRERCFRERCFRERCFRCFRERCFRERCFRERCFRELRDWSRTRKFLRQGDIFGNFLRITNDAQYASEVVTSVRFQIEESECVQRAFIANVTGSGTLGRD